MGTQEFSGTSATSTLGCFQEARIETFGDWSQFNLNQMSFGKEFWDGWYHNLLEEERSLSKSDVKPLGVDWYLDFEQLKIVLAPYLAKSDRVLVVGCGNSPFSEELADYFVSENKPLQSIDNIDYSPQVIEWMNAKYPKSINKYLVANVCNLEAFNDSEHDVVIDKGTLDSIL